MLWTPLFLAFRRALEDREEKTEPGAALVWAFALGTVFAVIHFIAGSFVRAAGFGISRWFYAFIDIVLPAALPFPAAFLLRLSRPRCFTPSAAAFRAFAFIALLPEGVFRALLWGDSANPLLLLFVPLLWTAVAEGMTFFAGALRHKGAAILGLALLPIAAPFSFWAFFGQRTLWGAAMFIVTAIPACLSITLSRGKNRRTVPRHE
jgi:hypothetical protein